MPKTWTDERLDDLAGRMDAGFVRVDDEISRLRTETNARFDTLQRTLIQTTVGISATMLTGFAALFALIAAGG